MHVVNGKLRKWLSRFIPCTSSDTLNKRNRKFSDDEYLQMNNVTTNNNVTSQK